MKSQSLRIKLMITCTAIYRVLLVKFFSNSLYYIKERNTKSLATLHGVLSGILFPIHSSILQTP